jgi:hypothetical protein
MATQTSRLPRDNTGMPMYAFVGAKPVAGVLPYPGNLNIRPDRLSAQERRFSTDADDPALPGRFMGHVVGTPHRSNEHIVVLTLAVPQRHLSIASATD